MSSTPGQLSILSYNVEGIVSKLCDPDFVTFVSQYDIVCFLETFVDVFTSTLFSSFTSFVAPAKKLSQRGRKSGGVIVLIRNSLMHFVKHVNMAYDNILVFEINNELLGTEAKVFLVSAYTNPVRSPPPPTHTHTRKRTMRLKQKAMTHELFRFIYKIGNGQNSAAFSCLC